MPLPLGIFVHLPFLGGVWACVAFGDTQVGQNFAQKRFALRPIIATKQDPHCFRKIFAVCCFLESDTRDQQRFRPNQSGFRLKRIAPCF